MLVAVAPRAGEGGLGVIKEDVRRQHGDRFDLRDWCIVRVHVSTDELAGGFRFGKEVATAVVVVYGGRGADGFAGALMIGVVHVAACDRGAVREGVTRRIQRELATNAQGTIVWRWEGKAFGDTAPNQDADGDAQTTVVNLCYPGQYADAETGLFYNWNRYYEPKTGRYITSEPIGIAGGLNSFT